MATKGKVFEPFWSAIGYRFWSFWCEIGYGMCTLIWNVGFRGSYLFFIFRNLKFFRNANFEIEIAEFI